MTTLLELRGADFSYSPSKPLLHEVDLQVRTGDFIGLIGPNGAGKSTLLHLLTGWLRPTSGAALLHDKPLSEWKRRDIAREIALAPQREEAAFPFTVEEVVLMGRYARQASTFAFSSEQDRRVASEALSEVGLDGFAQRRADELSGGERQRLLLARSLAQQTPILLLDEPTASLDLSHQRLLFTLLEKLNREKNLTVVAVSHDMNLAAMYCRELAVLHEGRIFARGTPPEILKEELLDKVFHVPLRVTEHPDGAPHVMMRR
ncbi:Fe3+-hydroxamate ABC transporter ATP-binding protein FhuC [soil metagenome]